MAFSHAIASWVNTSPKQKSVKRAVRVILVSGGMDANSTHLGAVCPATSVKLEKNA